METNKLQFPPIEKEGLRVLTTLQLAEAYGTTPARISYNFNYNKEHFIEGVHYFKLTGEEKRKFFNHHEIHDGSKARDFYLWTERGALLHAKSLNTEKAWEVYEFLIDNYYRAREIIAYQNNALLQQNEHSSSSLPMVADEVKTLCDKIERLSREFNLLKKDNEKLKEENRDFKQMYKQNQAKIDFLKEDFKELNKEKEQLQLENREFTQILKIKCEDIYNLKEENEKLNRKIQESDKYFNEIIQFNYENICYLKEDVKKIKDKAKRINDIIADRLNSLKRDSLIADTGIKILFEKLKK